MSNTQVSKVFATIRRAEQPGIPVIGFFNGQSAQTFRHLVAAFRRGLSEAGYVEGGTGAEITYNVWQMRRATGV